jgi:hypothetical protein
MLHNGILIVVFSAIGAAGVEAALRVWEFFDSTQTNADPLNRFDPVLGWANRAGARANFAKAEFAYPVAINTQGLRDKEVGPKQAEILRLAVLGDSFVWGWGVSDEERFTQILEASNPRLETLNFGVSGYGPAQYLLQLDEVLSFEPDFVLLTFSLGSDLVDTNVSLDGCRPIPRQAKDGSLSVAVGSFPGRCQRVYDPRSAGFRLRSIELIEEAFRKLWGGDDNNRAEELNELLHRRDEELTPGQRREIKALFALTEHVLDAIRKRVDVALGPGRFAVLVAPSIYEFDEYLSAKDDSKKVHAEVIALLQRLNIRTIDGRLVIKANDFWPKDGHWRPSAHTKIARLVARGLHAAVEPSKAQLRDHCDEAC